MVAENRLQSRHTNMLKEQIDLIKASSLFDSDWYLTNYSDVNLLSLDPVEHYVKYGAKLQRNPGPRFSTADYLRVYPDVANSGLNPLYHFLMWGQREGRKASLSVAASAVPRSLAKLIQENLSTHFTALPESAFRQQVNKITIEECPPELVRAIHKSEQRLTQIYKRELASAEQPLISVIMPTYNRADIIADSIATVTEQRYANWELFVCDDASTDRTAEIVASFKDARIRYLKLSKRGAAAARNSGLERARGTFIAYLDSDNYWHPGYMMAMVTSLLDHPGHSAIYADFIDFHVNENGEYRIKSFERPPFNHENLLRKPFIDLNSFVHRRELYDCFGGFNEELTRRQDYDLILKYTWLRDPLHFPYVLNLYHRNDTLDQITTAQKQDKSCIPIINQSLDTYFKAGLPLMSKTPIRRVTILSWDLCRNHFSKPFALAEALSRDYEVQLISFRFFEEEIFPPLKGVNPPFETVYFSGMNFPGFFNEMQKAVEAIRGDVVYVVKPRLPSLGIALLANYKRKIPVILEINDLETVVSSPKSKDQHKEVALESVDLSNPDLLNPYSNLWSQLMDPLAKNLPVLFTHNENIDAHFGKRCLYMRNLKDETVYDPGVYDRDAVRSGLGFGPDDRVILFGGLIRKHKGIYELVELVERLGESRYKLLFVGSRTTPDQKRLAEKYGDRIHVLPPQDREAMARINLASDLVILWLDPNVPASHYQMPYKATDAFAMGPAIIANDISDLGILAKQGYLRLASFGNWDQMTAVIHEIFDNPDKTAGMRAASRRLFLRQFSYAAARSNFELAAKRALVTSSCVLPAAEVFTKRFNAFYRQLNVGEKDFRSERKELKPNQLFLLSAGNCKGQKSKNDSVELIDVKHLDQVSYHDPNGTAVIMPCVDTHKGLETAKILVERAGMKTKVFVVEDTLRKNFTQTLNKTASQLNVKYVVYLTENAFPGRDWLMLAYETLETKGKSLLAFNCGKWRGRIAAFGMVRSQWVQSIYGKSVFFPGYTLHCADKELSVIGRITNEFIYNPNCTLVDLNVENKCNADGRSDAELFKKRFHGSFDARYRWRDVKVYKKLYLDQEGSKGNTASAVLKDEVIRLIDIKAIKGLNHRDPKGIVVVMPCIDTHKGMNTARLLLSRAGIATAIFVVEDTKRQGFIKTLNDTAMRLDVKYIVYLAEDAFPGVDWLKIAYTRLEDTGKGLLAFNCGKWHGRIAAFGMVRKSWVSKLYGGAIFYPEYKNHRADNELTVIARVTNQFIYNPLSVLIENDKKKVFREHEADASNFTPNDKDLFIKRFNTAFNGVVSIERLKPLAKCYRVPFSPSLNKLTPVCKVSTTNQKQVIAEGQTRKSTKNVVRSYRRKPISNSEMKKLKQEYIHKGLDKEQNTFVLYRIIGNDLQPRHKKGQSRENLRFILEHEQSLEGCEKRFIVNRIIDPNEERCIVDLLEEFSAAYTIIPFKHDEYKRIGFDVAVLDSLNPFDGSSIDTFDIVKRQRLQLALYRLKNNYVMNNNGARNFALQEGRSRAKWVLPFDGNSFITQTAWEHIRGGVTSSPHLKYFVVPMTRVMSNQDLLSESFVPEPIEEPQILFRKDASETFNESFCYGRRPKVELFWRLQFAGQWDAYIDDAWDQKRLPVSPDAGQFGVAGWVARLYSGMGQLESQDRQGARRRYLARADAILATLRDLDESLDITSGETLLSITTANLQEEREGARSSAFPMASALDVVRRPSDAAMTCS
jgi:glycosyltransferase involved in cell wall biosynthesis